MRRERAPRPWEHRQCENCGRTVSPAQATICALRGEPIRCTLCEKAALLEQENKRLQRKNTELRKALEEIGQYTDSGLILGIISSALRPPDLPF